MKRTPLRRKTRLRQVSEKRAARIASYSDVSRGLRMRSKGACEARLSRDCVGRGEQVHHRKLRSQGGRDEWEQLLHVCANCHAAIHCDPALAYSLGLLVHAHEDPAAVPVRVRSAITTH